MPEGLKDLIEKIQEEGVKAAEDRAKSIEEEASREAKAIVEKARKEARGIIAKAEEDTARMKESGKESLRQAARDLLLALKKEINATLDRIIVSHVREALSPQEMAKVIAQLLKGAKALEKGEVTISLKKEDLKEVERALLKELKEKTKEGITLKSREDIRGGFIISYDKGKSHYDFTDKAITDYLTLYLKPRLAEMLKEKK